MIQLDEDALICDLLETYNIDDYKQLPLTKVAVFSCGLKESSRIMMRINSQKVPLETLVLASISDKLANLLWSKTKDGEKGRNKPKLLVESIQGVKQQENDEVSFNSGEDFEKARKDIIGGV